MSSQIKEFDTLTSVAKGELYDPEEYLSQWIEKANTYVNEYLENPHMLMSRHAEQNIEIDDKGPGLELLLWNIEFFFLKKVIGIAQSRKVNDSYTSTFDENLKKKFLNTVHKIEESSMLASNKLKCLESVAMVWKPLYGSSTQRVSECLSRIVNSIGDFPQFHIIETRGFRIFISEGRNAASRLFERYLDRS